MKHISEFLMSYKQYIIAILTIACTGFLFFQLLPEKSVVLDDVSLKEKVSTNNTFAIYVDSGEVDDGGDIIYEEYTESDTFPAKADGYKYNSEMSVCTDNSGNITSNASLYYNNDMVQVSTSETVYCYIYFDLYSKDGDWCLVNDITDKLGECAIVMSDYYNDVDSAKTAIESKTTSTSAISPTITYNQSITTDQTVSLSTSSYYVVGTSISFSETTGMFTISSTTNTTDTTADVYNGYYTCASTSTTCATAYKINEYTVTVGTSSTTYKITNADKYTYSTGTFIDSDIGMYATGDDYGTSYYYRGSVNNNYVYFAGYYWRIIRVNGDGSVRMIYQGTTADATGTAAQIGTAAFNTTYSDPTYVGYKYGTLSTEVVTQESTTNFTNFNANTAYYFGTDYETTSSGTFKLSGTLVSGTFTELFGSGGTYEDDITSYYTCFSTSSTGTCTFLKKLSAYNSSTSAKVYYMAFSSTSYENTLTNENDSNIKIVVDDWYEKNILDKYDEEGTNLLSDYISTSAIFCGDRSVYSGSGYLLSASTTYNANRRINTYSPSLYCSSNSADSYSVDNGNLDYPIALITIDEAAFAGGRVNNVNTLYYLYTGTTYWTMSPSSFNSTNGSAYVWRVSSTGNLSHNWVTSSHGVRPVINLSSDVLISQGTGSASNPFVVTLTASE